MIKKLYVFFNLPAIKPLEVNIVWGDEFLVNQAFIDNLVARRFRTDSNLSTTNIAVFFPHPASTTSSNKTAIFFIHRTPFDSTARERTALNMQLVSIIVKQLYIRLRNIPITLIAVKVIFIQKCNISKQRCFILLIIAIVIENIAIYNMS